MIKRPLGKTGLNISELAFGCVEIGMPYGIGVNSVQDMPGESASIHLLQAALEAGINFFDTARLYGNSENIIGKAFKGCRSQVVIATKCRHFPGNPDMLSFEAIKQVIETSLQESLSALQTDYVDVYMLHQADIPILLNNNVCEVFASLKQSGLIRATGVSTYTNQQTELAIDKGGWDVIQVPFNLMDQRQAALFNKAEMNGTGLIIRSVLLKGLLSDKGTNLHPALAGVERHIKQFGMLTSLLDINLSTLATRFALSFPQVSAILVGIDKLSYLEQSVAAANGQYLSAELLEQAKSLAYPDPVFLDLPEWDRQGWLR